MKMRDRPDGAMKLRVCFNRDEQRTRPPAQPPQRRIINGHEALMPIDTLSQGTWIAVQDRGLILALLNSNPTHAPHAPKLQSSASRGRVIPSLLGADDLTTALRHLNNSSWQGVPPFRLVALDLQGGATVVWDGQALSAATHFDLHEPRMFTSSGLGDALVQEPRLGLFKQLMQSRAASLSPADQDAFHQHQWPDRPHLSVRMERADACTVSWTILECDSCQATLSYWTPQAPASISRMNMTLQAPMHAQPADDP